MGYVSRITDSDGWLLPGQLVEGTLTAAVDGTATDESDNEVVGEVVRVELKAATLKNSATVKGYESDALGAVGSRNDFCAAVGAGSAFAKEILPGILGTDIVGANLSGGLAGNVFRPKVHGKVTMALAGANEGEVVSYRILIR